MPDSRTLWTAVVIICIAISVFFSVKKRTTFKRLQQLMAAKQWDEFDRLLDANGYAGKYEIVQCAISEAKDACDEGADLLIATTVAPEGLTCPYVSGVPFMTGMNRVAAEKAVLDVMAQ